mmetsp:Transcript_113069/g.365189  ORF Transcript_113069/g.365189 Transcript_113069/m.365189 type:complete len:265 (+) Transcript_113069:73-867(+)
MDLICCTKRTRTASGSLFPASRAFGTPRLAGGDADASSSNGHKPAQAVAIDTGVATSSPDAPEITSPPAGSLKAESLPASCGFRGDDGTSSTTSGMPPDPFLVEGIAEEEISPIVRLKQHAALIRSQVRVRRQPASKSYGSLLPEESPEMIHMELTPAMCGQGLEPWVLSELAMWESEKACADRQEPLASVRLMRITKVKHLDNHDGGCSMRVRLQQADSHEVCEEILVHASPHQAKACSEALVDSINIVRALVGRSVHSAGAL